MQELLVEFVDSKAEFAIIGVRSFNAVVFRIFLAPGPGRAKRASPSTGQVVPQLLRVQLKEVI